MNRDERKEAVLKLLAPWVGIRAAFPLDEGESAEDESEVRVFDWGKVKDLEDIREAVSDLFGDSEPDDFKGLRRAEEDEEWTTFADSWLPIAITGTGGQAFVSHDDPEFYFPQFAYLVLVNLDEFDGASTPLYALDVDGTAIPSPTVPRFTQNREPQTVGTFSLCVPVNPAGEH